MQSVHGSSVYCTVPFVQYKPQHTPMAQWYQYYCVKTLARHLLPVTVRMPLAIHLTLLDYRIGRGLRTN